MKAKTTAQVTIRHIPREVHQALRLRAARHGRSTEAEIRSILEAAVKPAKPIRLGSLLASIGRELGGVDLAPERDRTASAPIDLG